MNFIKRAFTSIKRNLGKTCLLFLIVLILCSVISGTISANQAAENTERNLFNNMLSIAQLEFDWSALMEAEGVDPNDHHWEPDPDTIVRLTPDMISQIGALPYVESYDFFVEAWNLRTLDAEMYEPPMDDNMGGGIWMDESEFGTSFTLRGVQNPNVFDIETGLIELVHGRVFTEYEIENVSYVILISEEFAGQNGLIVGSTISFRNIVFTPQEDMGWDPGHFVEENIFAEETYDVEVIGIFRLANPPDLGDPWSNWDYVQRMGNRIYAPNSLTIQATLFEMEASLESDPDNFWRWGMTEDGTTPNPADMIWIQHFFSLYTPSDFPAFREAIGELFPFFMIIDTGGALRGISAALESMRSLTQTILWLAIGASLLILTLLITLFLRDRKREVGIYLALGEKKRKLISQFVVEIMVVAFISIVVALFAGNILSANLSENMLISDLAADDDGRDQSWALWEDNPFLWQGYVNIVDTDEIIASYDVSLDLMTILLFFAIGLGTTLIATVIPMIYVVRLNPKKIMM